MKAEGRNPGLVRDATPSPDFATLHPGYGLEFPAGPCHVEVKSVTAAVGEGVELYALGAQVSPEEIVLERRLSAPLSPLK